VPGRRRTAAGHFGIGHRVALAGARNRFFFEAVLAIVQVPVAAVRGIQHVVVAALDDAAVLDHEDLVRTPDRREPVCDHDVVRPAIKA